ncbi:MAG: hypothetical protein IKL68_01425 [Clostridia bacterium]|nr:hypothetical protein [Clostridia bacterium]
MDAIGILRPFAWFDFTEQGYILANNIINAIDIGLIIMYIALLILTLVVRNKKHILKIMIFALISFVLWYIPIITMPIGDMGIDYGYNPHVLNEWYIYLPCYAIKIIMAMVIVVDSAKKLYETRKK